MTDAPDLAAPVAGWRIWRLRVDAGGPTLVSPAVPTVWPHRTAITAACAQGCAQPPSWGCRCGLYALADLGDELRPLIAAAPFVGCTVLGCTALWGRVVEATDGWRGERAYPLVLFVCPARPPLRGAHQIMALRPLTVTGHVLDDVADDVAEHLAEETLPRLLGRRYAVPAYPLSEALPGLVAQRTVVSQRAAVVRDEAAHGLAARRLGDRDAEERFATAVETLLDALRSTGDPAHHPTAE